MKAILIITMMAMSIFILACEDVGETFGEIEDSLSISPCSDISDCNAKIAEVENEISYIDTEFLIGQIRLRDAIREIEDLEERRGQLQEHLAQLMLTPEPTPDPTEYYLDLLTPQGEKHVKRDDIVEWAISLCRLRLPVGGASERDGLVYVVEKQGADPYLLTVGVSGTRDAGSSVLMYDEVLFYGACRSRTSSW